MNKKIIRLSAIALVCACNLYAQEKQTNELKEVVVSDSKFALPKEKSGKVIVKITAEDLKKQQGQSLANVLSTVAGLEINGNQSGAGKILGAYVRGGRNHQVLVLLDGIPLTDASGVSSSYDLRLIAIEQIESIEIMKGASSTLYGTGAATGIINITLKKASKKAVAGTAYMSVGTQTVAKERNYLPQDNTQGFSVDGSSSQFNYFASLNSTEITGISEAKPKETSEIFEKDKFSKINALVKLGFTPIKKLSLDFLVNYDRLKNSFDAGAFQDNSKNFGLSEQYRIAFSPKYKYQKGEVVLNSGANFLNRDIYNLATLYNYKSRSANFDAYNKCEINKEISLVTGAQFQFHEMENGSKYGVITAEMANFSLIDPYFTAVYNSDFGLNLNIGARYSIHNRYGKNLIYNFNPSYNFSGLPLKVLASFSTAFITPSLYQLYSPYGNIDLKAQKDATAEVGFEVNLLKNKIQLNAVAFWREEKTAIGYRNNKYYNLDGYNNARGVETMVSYAITTAIKWNANYTFTNLEQKASALIPKHKVNSSLDVQATSRLGINVGYQYLSDRYYEYSIFGPAPDYASVLVSEPLKHYQLFNAIFRFDLIKNSLSVFSSVNNIFDEDFVEARGYSTRGRNFKLGFNMQF